MHFQEIKSHLEKQIKGQILTNEKMCRHTSWHIGGPADFMVFPTCVDDIKRTIAFARENNVPVITIGNGSNLLVKDKGIRGIVIKISRGFNKIEIKDHHIIAEAGALLPVLAKRASDAGLSGLEFAAGIPASVGGAVFMNAGAHGKSMSEVIHQVTVLGVDGQLKVLNNKESGFCYRKSAFRDQPDIILSALFILENAEVTAIKMKNEENLVKRRRSQPLEYPNAGSVFANPPGNWAGYLIEQAGCKGMRVGDAMVSEKHANFIVNAGSSTATEVLALIDCIKERVREKFHIELSLEVRVMGE